MYCQLRRLPVALVLVTACVPSSRDVFRPVDAELARRLDLTVAWQTSATDGRVPAAVQSLLATPLDLQATLKIALANNRRLRVNFDELGVSAAAVAAATVLEPLEIDASYKFERGGDGREIEIDAIQDVLGLLQLGQRRNVASAELAAAQVRATGAVLELVAEVEATFYELVAAQQELELRQTAFDAASASAELVERMHGAGNTTDLALARERELRESLRLQIARARLEVEMHREHLNQLMGLAGTDTAWRVERRLADVPDAPPALDDLEHASVASSLDLAALRWEAEAAAGQVGIERVRAWLPSLGLGMSAANRDAGWEIGPAVRVGIPLFNQNQGARARARALLRIAQNRYAVTAVELRTVARLARQRVLITYAEARHVRTVVLPLRERILEETLKQYNAMNASTFELLEARRDLVAAGGEYIDAVRRYWTALADVKTLRRGGMRSLTGGSGNTAEGKRDESTEKE